MNKQEQGPGLPIRFQLEWIAKIALSMALLAGLGLVLELSLVAGGKGTEYGQIILSRYLTRETLGPATLLFGLALTVMASLITWLISLYASFRIAGPLYRFTLNMKNAMGQSRAAPVSIRSTDLLQQEWQAFRSSLNELDAHYGKLEAALHEARQALPEATASAALRQAVVRMAEIERLVQL